MKNGSTEHRTAVFSELRGEQCLVGHVTCHVQRVGLHFAEDIIELSKTKFVVKALL